MRKNPTEAEHALWRLLRNKRLADWKWKRQERIDHYIVDHDILAQSNGVLTAILAELATDGASSPVARTPSPRPSPARGEGAEGSICG
jgi:hypothetical protein